MKILKSKRKILKFFNSPYVYNDNYVNYKNNNYFSFNFITTLLGFNLYLNGKDDIN